MRYSRSFYVPAKKVSCIPCSFELHNKLLKYECFDESSIADMQQKLGFVEESKEATAATSSDNSSAPASQNASDEDIVICKLCKGKFSNR